MKIARCSAAADERPFWAVLDLDRGTARPLAGDIADWGPQLTADPGAVAALAGPECDLEPLHLLAPLERTAKIIGAGANYAKHLDALGFSVPQRPVLFLKTWDTMIGPGDPIRVPPITECLDYEAELVVVVGAPVSPDAPSEAILGYTVGNDVSARDLQMGAEVTGMDLFSGKALDGTAGIGPWIVTRDEFGDASPDLALRLTVDGEVRQDDRTSSMVWGTGELAAFVDDRSRLRAGDVIFTGTPSGVGHEDGRYLEPGQEVVVSIEGIGNLRNTVAAAGASR